jgi:type VI secretion system secreted protein VgrG
MADFSTCLAWTLTFEDPLHKYATTPDSPLGSYAIAGINSAAWPKDFATINALGPDYRPAAVAQFYQEEFWNQWFEQLTSDDVAKRVFDEGVNDGTGPDVKIFQRAINSLRGTLVVDGQLGPATMAAANNLPSDALVAAFKAGRVAHYQAIVAANPADEKYLTGWLARANM